MTESVLEKLFEHNNWANHLIITACNELTDEQLDSTTHVGTDWSIRHTVSHLVESQRGYLGLLILALEERQNDSVSFDDLLESAQRSGEGLLALARDTDGPHFGSPVRSRDGYIIEPWVIMIQAINHATEHRRQVCGMMREIGETPPDIDGWGFGETSGAVAPIST